MNKFRIIIGRIDEHDAEIVLGSSMHIARVCVGISLNLLLQEGRKARQYWMNLNVMEVWLSRAWFQVYFTKWHLTWLHLRATLSFNGSNYKMNFVDVPVKCTLLYTANCKMKNLFNSHFWCYVPYQFNSMLFAFIDCKNGPHSFSGPISVHLLQPEQRYDTNWIRLSFELDVI